MTTLDLTEPVLKRLILAEDWVPDVVAVNAMLTLTIADLVGLEAQGLLGSS